MVVDVGEIIEMNICLICDGECYQIPPVDMITKTYRSMGHSKTGRMITYVKCTICGFIFTPEMCGWTYEEFKKQIYNEDYYRFFDQGYAEERPRTGAIFMNRMFGSPPENLSHLDYGGGHGYMVAKLKACGWNSTSYDPFVNTDITIDELGTFDVITCFEVFEHVPKPKELIPILKKFMHRDSVVMFGVDPNDDKLIEGVPLDEWWYVLPRGGHVSLHSRKSLQVLVEQFGLTLTASDALQMWVLHYGNEIPTTFKEKILI